jgi:hypothetical protein
VRLWSSNHLTAASSASRLCKRQKAFVADLRLRLQCLSQIRPAQQRCWKLRSTCLPLHFEKFIAGDADRLKKYFIQRTVKEEVWTQRSADSGATLINDACQKFYVAELRGSWVRKSIA